MGKRTVYYVSPQGDGDWKVKKEGATKATNVYANKEDAVQRAKELAKNQELGQVKIQKSDGKFQTEHTYGKDPFPPKG